MQRSYRWVVPAAEWIAILLGVVGVAFGIGFATAPRRERVLSAPTSKARYEQHNVIRFYGRIRTRHLQGKPIRYFDGIE